MDLTQQEIDVLLKMFNKVVTPEVERDDVEHHINGPRYYYQIDSLYDRVFRPYMKHGISIIDNKEATDLEQEVVRKLWEKVSEHFDR